MLEDDGTGVEGLSLRVIAGIAGDNNLVENE